MASILLAYFSVDGQTRKICEFLRAELEGQGQHADVVSIASGIGDPASYDVIVIGASIRYGKHNPAVREFTRANRALLESRPSGFFSVNLVARKSGKDTPETNPYVKKFLAGVTWKPRLVGVFAGKLDYGLYGFADRHIIRLIMWLTGGSTDLQARVEYTDWDAVRRYSGMIAALVPRR